MIEILILARFCSKIGAAARAKGRGATWYQLLLICLWFAFEIVGGFGAAIVLSMALGDQVNRFVWLAYLVALAGAGIGASIAFQVVRALPDLRNETAN